VVTVSSTGAVLDVIALVDRPEGLAMNPAGNRLYVASVAAPDSIYSVTIPDLAVSALPFEPDLGGGYYPAGLVYYAGKLFFCGDSGVTNERLMIDFYDL
jgi:hypothetical protein